jgi:hypothetical protein
MNDKILEIASKHLGKAGARRQSLFIINNEKEQAYALQKNLGKTQ